MEFPSSETLREKLTFCFNTSNAVNFNSPFLSFKNFFPTLIFHNQYLSVVVCHCNWLVRSFWKNHPVLDKRFNCTPPTWLKYSWVLFSTALVKEFTVFAFTVL